MNYLCLVGAGFLVSLGIIIVLGAKGSRYPGGSLACGFVVAQSLGVNVVLGAICGLVGWLLMLAIVRLTQRASDLWDSAPLPALSTPEADTPAGHLSTPPQAGNANRSADTLNRK